VKTRALRPLILGLFMISLFSLNAEAQKVTFDGCRDINGYAVASVSNASIQDIAMATIANGNPVILYNPYVLANTRAQTRLFFYAHECGHHALGHALKGLRLGQEQEADCWAINKLVELKLVSDQDISLIQADIARFGRGDWTHLPVHNALSICAAVLTRMVPLLRPSLLTPRGIGSLKNVHTHCIQMVTLVLASTFVGMSTGRLCLVTKQISIHAYTRLIRMATECGSRTKANVSLLSLIPQRTESSYITEHSAVIQFW
jgi:hypothetical protein